MTTKGRRTKQDAEATQETPAISQLGTAPLLLGAGLLEHGLDTSEEIYVWVNKSSPTDINGKLRAGFRVVKLSDVKARLEENGIPTTFYSEDEAGNICYGVDLILMRGSRAQQYQAIKAALLDQNYVVNDASTSEIQHRLDDILSTTPVSGKIRPQIFKDEDHGTKQLIEVKEN